ncbi:ABC transporter permease [Acetatifactor muris]|uniref:ABC transporter permease n=1 Tax=Acetatifactor muris TaxID=879566 RepID=UPI0023F20E15|nr:ABC transporter permease subunit [Acetatifactor muris]
MWELIKYELQKLMKKKLVWAFIVGMALMQIAMTCEWIYPGPEVVQYFQDGSLVALEGKDAIRAAKAIGKKYEGPLTDGKVQAILAEYTMSDEDMTEHSLDPSIESYYSHNFLYSALNQFYTADGSWNGMTVQEVYGELAPDLTLGYGSGWERLLFAVVNTLLSLGCVVTIILAPLFSEEYTKRTDALILTGAYGKTKCAWAKIIASFTVSMSLTALVILLFGAVFLFHYGTDGWNASIQLGQISAFTAVPYPMTYGQGILYALLLWFTAGLTLTAVAILISAVAKSTFTSLVISFALFVVPMFLPWRKWRFLNLPAQFFPVRQIQLADIFTCPLLEAGAFQLNIIWLSIPVALAATLICVFYARRAFARHQVMG